MSRVYSSLALALCVLAGCADRDTKSPARLPSGPPPLPTLPSPVDGAEAADAVGAAAKSQASSPSASKQRKEPLSAPPAPKAKEPSLAKERGGKGAAREPSSPARAQAPESAAPSPAPLPAPSKVASRVTVPNTAHVHPELPSGLQRDLDADPRMQSWLDRAFAIIDGCHGQNRAASGTIEVVLTMHENERPDADIRALPPALSAVVACSTGALMRTKMPLFTGAEGTRYTTRIRFD